MSFIISNEPVVTQTQSSTHFSPTYHFIDLLRGFSALWVLVAHCAIWSGFRDIPIPSPKLAVDLFMMISGFLMMRIADSVEQRDGFLRIPALRSFYLARFFRIAPTYYLSLFLVIFLQDQYLGGYSSLRIANTSLWINDRTYDPATVNFSATNIFVHVTFLFGLFPSYSFSTFLPDWSLSLEMQFYAFFPFLYLLVRRYGLIRVAVLLGSVTAVLGLGHYALVKLRWLPNWAIYPEPSLLLLKLPYFLAGMVIFRRMNSRNATERLRLGVLVLALCSWELNYRMAFLALPSFAALFMLLSESEQHGFFRARSTAWLVNSSVVRFMSDCSYGVYLFHGFFISIFGAALLDLRWAGRAASGTFFLVLLLLVCVAAYGWAYMVHRLVEIPGIRIGRHLNTQWSALSSLKFNTPA